MIDWAATAKRQRCPSCGRDHESGMRGTLGVTTNADGSGVAHCFRCEHVEWRGADGRAGSEAGTTPLRKVEIKHEALSEWGRELWASLDRIQGDGAAYLRARECVLPPTDGHLRYHPALRHPPSGMLGPALVALVTDALTGAPLTLHRTWIQADGRKAPFDPPRMLLGGHRKAGGVVRIWPDEAVTTGLGIAEGVESALSLAHAFTPVWSLLDAGNLASLPVLAGIESLLIAADNDEAGIRSTNVCAERWVAAGREVHIAMPGAVKTDLNDVAREAA